MLNVWVREETYVAIGAAISIIAYLVLVLYPLICLCFWRARNFINDYEYTERAYLFVKLERKFSWIRFSSDGCGMCTDCSKGKYLGCYWQIFTQLGGVTFALCIATLIWPVILIYATGYSILHFLRLASRLERHSADIGAHGEAQEAEKAEQYDEATLAGMKDFEERKKAAKIGEDGMIDMGTHKVHPDSPMGKTILGKR